jgi:hypothetical protein
MDNEEGSTDCSGLAMNPVVVVHASKINDARNRSLTYRNLMDISRARLDL